MDHKANNPVSNALVSHVCFQLGPSQTKSRNKHKFYGARHKRCTDPSGRALRNSLALCSPKSQLLRKPLVFNLFFLFTLIYESNYFVASSDELVSTVIKSIPPRVKQQGVFPEPVLRARFLKVEKVARQLSLVPENGGRLPLYFLSYLQSILLLEAPNAIPQTELNDEVVDFSKLTNNDILQRARYVFFHYSTTVGKLNNDTCIKAGIGFAT